MNGMNETGLDETDRRLVRAMQAGLPLVRRPYHAIAQQLGLPVEEVMDRLRQMLVRGGIRRIGLVPDHYRLGLAANGMTVWDVPDERISRLGAMVGALEFVSHCYHRPRVRGLWPYNLFAMVHGRSRKEVEDKAGQIAQLLGEADRGHEILYSKRILKKTGLRIS